MQVTQTWNIDFVDCDNCKSRLSYIAGTDIKYKPSKDPERFTIDLYYCKCSVCEAEISLAKFDLEIPYFWKEKARNHFYRKVSINFTP